MATEPTPRQCHPGLSCAAPPCPRSPYFPTGEQPRGVRKEIYLPLQPRDTCLPRCRQVTQEGHPRRGEGMLTVSPGKNKSWVPVGLTGDASRSKPRTETGESRPRSVIEQNKHPPGQSLTRAGAVGRGRGLGPHGLEGAAARGVQ